MELNELPNEEFKITILYIVNQHTKKINEHNGSIHSLEKKLDNQQ